MLRLRFLRLSQDISQAAVAEATGLPRQNLRWLEYGRLKPTDKELRVLGEYFKIPNPERLFDHVVDPMNADLPRFD